MSPLLIAEITLLLFMLYKNRFIICSNFFSNSQHNSLFVTVQRQADLSKKSDECLHSRALFCINLFGGYATPRKRQFSRLALNSYHYFIFSLIKLINPSAVLPSNPDASIRISCLLNTINMISSVLLTQSISLYITASSVLSVSCSSLSS